MFKKHSFGYSALPVDHYMFYTKLLFSLSIGDNDEGILAKCKFWIQGVLITLIGLFGIAGNLVSSMIKDVEFHVLVLDIYNSGPSQ